MDEDISLPKATLAKVIRDAMPAGMRVSGDTVDLLVHCCNEFVHVISTQSNVVSEREKRATISPEHVLRALEELGFESYVEGVTAAWHEWRDEQQQQNQRLGGKRAGADSGMTREQMLELQQRLFQQARDRSGPFEPGMEEAA